MAAVSGGCRAFPARPRNMPGTDFIIARDGKIAAVYLFFDELP
jgi:hypothetical protein